MPVPKLRLYNRTCPTAPASPPRPAPPTPRWSRSPKLRWSRSRLPQLWLGPRQTEAARPPPHRPAAHAVYTACSSHCRQRWRLLGYSPVAGSACPRHMRLALARTVRDLPDLLKPLYQLDVICRGLCGAAWPGCCGGRRSASPGDMACSTRSPLHRLVGSSAPSDSACHLHAHCSGVYPRFKQPWCSPRVDSACLRHVRCNAGCRRFAQP